jgi:hypothetical protein
MTDNNNDSIIVPALNIEEKITPICDILEGLSQKTQKVNILLPIISILRLNKIKKEQQKLRAEYDNYESKCIEALTTPCSGAGFTLAFIQSWSTAKGLSALIRLKSGWYEIDALIDRKYSFSIATLSLYIALISFIVSMYFGLYAPLQGLKKEILETNNQNIENIVKNVENVETVEKVEKVEKVENVDVTKKQINKDKNENKTNTINKIKAEKLITTTKELELKNKK